LALRTRIVTPVTAPLFGPGSRLLDDLVAAARPDNRVDHVQIDEGPASIECEVEEALAIPDTLRKIVDAERDGVDAVVINCMGDPGLYPARQLVRIPVVGPFQAAAHLAMTLGHRFAVVSVVDSVVPMFWDRAAVYGVRSHMASVRVVDLPVLELEADRERLVARLAEQGAAAILADGADTLVFGCTGMTGVAADVASALARRGIDVPVIDPAPAAVKWAELLVDQRLAASRRAFPPPPVKACVGYAGVLPAGHAP
jgi:allantoin racemase